MKAFEAVTMYRTADGVLHKSEKDAQKHAESFVIERVGKAVKKALLRTKDTMHLLIPVTEAIMAERAEIREALEMEVAFEEGLK